MYADGKYIGDGEWAKRENSIDVNRFRIPTTSQVVGIWIEGIPKARAGRSEEIKSAMSGVIGSIADSLVTSSSWSCTYFKKCFFFLQKLKYTSICNYRYSVIFMTLISFY